MLRIAAVLSLFILACQDGRMPVDPVGGIAEDNAVQLADIRGNAPALSPEQLDALWAATKITDQHHQAWIEPDPNLDFWGVDVSEIGNWESFTVQTKAGIDSLYVMINLIGGPWVNPAFEIAGGTNAPTRSFCPPEINDTPSRARRDGWGLHIQTCRDQLTQEPFPAYWFDEDGEGEIDGYTSHTWYILYDIIEGELVVYGHGSITALYYDKE